MVYKVSYVVLESEHPGAIVSEFERPKVGAQVEIGDNVFEIVDVSELMPPRGEFSFLHATVRFVKPAGKD